MHERLDIRDDLDDSTVADLLVLQRHLGEWVASSFVVAEFGFVLASSAPARPGPDVLGGSKHTKHQLGQQAAGLRYSQIDHALLTGADSPFTATDRLTTSQA